MQKLYVTYEEIHERLCAMAGHVIRDAAPEVIVAIGGGGYIPARILRTWLKVPIIGVSVQLYTENDTLHKDGPQKIQWVDECGWKAILGKRVLLVDEVDDTRTTLHYCVKELQSMGAANISVLVIHNKEKPKDELKGISHYFRCSTVPGSTWIVYPWEANDIAKHNEHAYTFEKFDNFTRLPKENTQLTNENTQLTKENAQLIKENARLYKEILAQLSREIAQMSKENMQLSKKVHETLANIRGEDNVIPESIVVEPPYQQEQDLYANIYRNPLKHFKTYYKNKKKDDKTEGKEDGTEGKEDGTEGKKKDIQDENKK